MRKLITRKKKFIMLYYCINLYLLQFILIFNLFEQIKATDIDSDSKNMTKSLSNSNSSTTISKELDSVLKTKTKFLCDVHENCSTRILTLDAYCCQSDPSYCCNWFEFSIKISTSQSSKNLTSPLEYKPPTSLTIITILIISIALMFILYCFCVFFCYCFKCGLFRKPKLIILNSLPNSASSSGSDSTSAHNIITPKHSNVTSDDSNSSADASPIRRNHRHAGSNRSSKYNNNIARAYSSSNNNYKRSKRGSNSQSPTARASSNPRNNSSSRNRHLYADPQCYVDFDNNESPFLIQSAPTRGSTRSNEVQRHGSRRSNTNRQSSASQNRRNSSSSIQRTTSTSSHRNHHPIGTAVALIDDDILLTNNTTSHQLLETIAQSRSNSRSSLSIDLGGTASLIDDHVAVEMAEQNTNELITTTRITEVVAATASASAPYYMDEKPPSYDDIIKNDNLNKLINDNVENQSAN